MQHFLPYNADVCMVELQNRTADHRLLLAGECAEWNTNIECACLKIWLLALVQSTSKRRPNGLIQKLLSNKTKVF